jgi:DNA-nicking Smr family endonuclease
LESPISFEENTQDAEFFEELRDVKPLKPDNKVTFNSNVQTLAQQLKRQAIEQELQQLKNYLSVEKVEPIDPYAQLSYKKDGVQEGIFKNLRLRKYRFETVINLQGLKFDQAREQLFNGILEQHKLGLRTLLVRHVLGLYSKPFPVFLKSYVKQWLGQLPEIIAFHSAMTQHGGSAATYVMLRKNQDERPITGDYTGKISLLIHE